MCVCVCVYNRQFTPWKRIMPARHFTSCYCVSALIKCHVKNYRRSISCFVPSLSDSKDGSWLKNRRALESTSWRIARYPKTTYRNARTSSCYDLNPVHICRYNILNIMLNLFRQSDFIQQLSFETRSKRVVINKLFLICIYTSPGESLAVEIKLLDLKSTRVK